MSSSAATERSKAQCSRMSAIHAEKEDRAEAHRIVLQNQSKKKRVSYSYDMKEAGGDHCANDVDMNDVWPTAHSDEAHDDDMGDFVQEEADEEEGYWPSSQDGTGTSTPSESSSLDSSTYSFDEPVRKAESCDYEPDKDGFNIIPAGSQGCFSQGGVWVCKCLKRPVLNFKLLHIFCSQVLEEKLHLSTDVGKWASFAERLIGMHPTFFGPPWSPISGSTVQSRLNTCLDEVRQKRKIPVELESKEGGGTGSMWEDHQVTGYDSVVLMIDKEIKLRDKAKRDESKSDKEAMTKANCMHFEGLGVMPGIISGAGVSPDDQQDFNDTSMDMSEDTDENAPPSGETAMRAIIPAGRRKRAAAAAFASRSTSEFKELLDSIEGTPEERAAAAAKAEEAAENRRIDREERKAEIARQQIGQDLLLAMLHQMKNGMYSSGRGAVLGVELYCLT
ncbi:hypothetical protein B484DRAFT_468128 [Ochromonadaceae sp. CCMP2298]|nr:hypothetical protein B484DRAFT_468128 [Ochromonadaceae sp. CCMP2298]